MCRFENLIPCRNTKACYRVTEKIASGGVKKSFFEVSGPMVCSRPFAISRWDGMAWVPGRWKWVVTEGHLVGF